MPSVRWCPRLKVYGYLAIWLGTIALLFACSSSSVEVPPVPPEAPAAERRERPPVEDYEMGPEDVVEVMVWKNEDLSRVVSVRPDGKISLPLIGDLLAAGETAEQLKASIVKALKQYYQEPPQVSVIVQQVNSYAIYILGQVQTLGRYVVKSSTTFLQALSLAGGFTPYASTKRIVLRRQRRDGQGEDAMRVRFDDVVVGKQQNLLLRRGDTIVVP